MVSKGIYCGAGPVPKKQKLGTMKECAESKQIRYWGVKKIDPKMLEYSKNFGKNKTTTLQLQKKIVVMRSKIKKIKEDIKYEKNKDKKAEMQANVKKLITDLNNLIDQLDALNKMKKGSRKASRKGSKKASRGSRKASRGSRKGSKKGSRKASRGSRKGSKKGSRKGSKKGSKRISRKASRGSKRGSRKGSKRR